MKMLLILAALIGLMHAETKTDLSGLDMPKEDRAYGDMINEAFARDIVVSEAVTKLTPEDVEAADGVVRKGGDNAGD